MFLGLSILLLTCAVITFAFWPAFFAKVADESDEARSDFDHDLAVYRDQLNELKRETERGVISELDAEQARAEIGRRLLDAEGKARAGKGSSSAENGLNKSQTALFGLLITPIGALALYLWLGAPMMDAQPLAVRLEAERALQIAADQDSAQLRQLVARAEAHLNDNPNDGRGWDVLAPIYFRLGENEKAIDAYQRSIQINGEDARRLSGLGEAQVALTGGLIGEQSANLFKRAAALNADDGKTQFYLGLIEAQSGNLSGASTRWRAVVNNPNIDSTWKAVAQSRLDGLIALSAEQATNGNVGAPSLDDETIEAAGNMGEQDRQAMIESMVDGLSKRLIADGGSIEEWQRLIRARLVLGQTEQAAQVLQIAIDYYAGDEAKQSLMRNFADSIVLPGQERQ